MKPRSAVLPAAFLVLAAFIADMAFGPSLSIGSARPAISLLTLVSVAMFVGPLCAAYLGLAVGVMQGAWAGAWLGSYIATRSVTAWAVALVEQRVVRENVLVAPTIVAMACLGCDMLFFVSAPQPSFSAFVTASVQRAAYSAVVAVPVFRMVHRLLSPRQPG